MSENNRVSPSANTVRRLIADSGGYCAVDNAPLIHMGEKMVGQIAHIHGVKPTAARFDPSISENDLAEYNNLIYICNNCHKYIDDKKHEEEWPAEKLRILKENHKTKLEGLYTSFIILAAGQEAVRPKTLKKYFELSGTEYQSKSYNDDYAQVLYEFNAVIDALIELPPDVRRFYKAIIDISKDKYSVPRYQVRRKISASDQDIFELHSTLEDDKLSEYEEDGDEFCFRVKLENVLEEFISEIAKFGEDYLEKSLIDLDFSWAD